MYQIMLYTLNLYSVICQLYLNRIKREKEAFQCICKKKLKFMFRLFLNYKINFHRVKKLTHAGNGMGIQEILFHMRCVPHMSPL